MTMFFASIFDAPDSVPSSWYEPMLMPVLFTFFGLVVFVGGRFYETQNNKNVKGKWVGAALLFLALILGLARVIHLTNNIYTAIIADYGKKMVYSHWVAFLFPLFLSIGAGVWYVWDKRRSEFR